MNTDRPKSGPARIVDVFKRRPYVAPLVLIAVAFVAIWALNRERQLELNEISPAVLAALPQMPCGSEPKFRTLKLKLKRVFQERGGPMEMSIERVETYLRQGIALRRERWFQGNEISPVVEIRSFVVCGLLTLDYHERSPTPAFGAVMRESGWSHDRITALEVRESKGFPNVPGSVFDYTKTSVAELNPGAGPRELIVKPTRCVVASRINADKAHPKLTGEGYHVNCTSELDVTIAGGPGQQEKKEKLQRVSVYYYIAQLGWLMQVRESEGEKTRSFTTLTEFSVE